jgi:Bacterial membrane protein YfhO
VAYVLTPAAEALPEGPATFTLVFRSPSTRIYRLAGAAPYFTATNPSCSVGFRSRESVQLRCRGPTRLIRRETDLPGWSAHVDGQPLRVRRVDGLFQAVTVPSGSHHVTFDYGPPKIGLGFVAFAAGCAWLLLAPATACRRRGGRGSPTVG